MATAILRSHDCLRGSFGLQSLDSPTTDRNPNYRMNHISRCRRRKRSPSGGNRHLNHEVLPLSAGKKALVMGQVKILKRGEELEPRLFFGSDDLDLDILCTTDRLGPDPEVVQKQIRVPDLYAGSTSIVSSPPPSSLPFPASLVRSRLMESDLRKLLKI